MRIFPPTRIFLSKSSIHGYGIFANTFIKKDELIEECPILDLGAKPGEPCNILNDYRFNWPYGTTEWEKQVVAWGWGSLYNHSNDPNASWRSNHERNTFEFYAIKDIKPFEEILVFYGGESYWLDGRTHVNVI